MPTTTRAHSRPSTEVPFQEGLLDPRADTRLEYGGRLREVRVAYSLAGPPGAPVVAVLGGISADRHVWRPGPGGGWWEGMVGRGRPLDLEAWRVLSIDYLGGPGESEVGRAGGEGGPTRAADFPVITPRDQAHALAAVAERLGPEPLRGVIGASYGGAVALAFAADHPELARGAMVIGAAHRSHPLATAVRIVQRRIVRRALARGDEHGGLALARALAMTTYRSDREFEERFAGPPSMGEEGPTHPVESYLDHHGERFAQRFSAAEFLCLSQSLDLHRVDPGSVQAPVTLVSVDPDMLAPRWQVEELARRLPGRCKVVRIDSRHGHDAFLTDGEAFAPVVAGFLADPELDS